MTKARVRVVIEYDTDIPDDPDAYEGETTPEGRIAKEKAYIEEGGDYLFSALGHIEHTCVATVTPEGQQPVDPEVVAYVVSDVETREGAGTTVIGARADLYDLDHRDRAHEDVARHPEALLFLGVDRNCPLKVYRLVRDV